MGAFSAAQVPSRAEPRDCAAAGAFPEARIATLDAAGEFADTGSRAQALAGAAASPLRAAG